MDRKNIHTPSLSHEGVSKVSLDPFPSLNLKEASKVPKRDGNRNVMEGPCTPGRSVFSFSVVGSKKKPVPSKWNDAEKWLVSDHHHQSPNHHLDGFIKSKDLVSKRSSTNNEFGTQEKVISEERVSIFEKQHHKSSDPFDVLKDPSILKFECSTERLVFKESSSRDIGTEMTPLGSSTTSRCSTPFKALSPPRHNTPATRSGPLDPNTSLDIQDCHLEKLNSSNSNWTSREEEEDDAYKSLRLFSECRKSVSSASAACAWEVEDKTRCCLRYQREEEKIQAWVDLQKAKAEAQSRKLEVKIQNMRSKFEEKLMKRMEIVHKKADELRVIAQLEHTQKVKEEAINQHINMQFSGRNRSCGCFPCNNLHS